MSIAVIILNYNGQHWLEACLSAVQQLTVPVEMVVADNASQDNSLAYLRERWPQVRVLAFEKNYGFAEGYNRAITAIHAEWIAMLNTDAVLSPNWLAVLLAFAEQNPRAAILGGKLLLGGSPAGQRILQAVGSRITDAGTAFEVGWGQPDTGQFTQPHITASIPAAALLMRRAKFLELGGFDAAYFAYLEDVDLCWRAWLAGDEVWCVPAAEATHHFGGTAGGRASPFRIQWMQRNRYANMLKHLAWPTFLSGLLTSGLYDAYRVLEFGLSGQWAALRALAMGTWAAVKALPQLWAARRTIQSQRQISDADLRAKGLLVSAFIAFQEYRRLAQVTRPT